ncbi:hypothetical protein ELY25_05995 [Vreelandella populi]|nr:hypothetical protein ELY25_05995 [Halomonas populi]
MNKRRCGHHDEKGNRMRANPDWKPLAIVGAVLLMNGFVFLLITLSAPGGALWGAALGCLTAGIPLLLTGCIKRARFEKLNPAGQALPSTFEVTDDYR